MNTLFRVSSRSPP